MDALDAMYQPSARSLAEWAADVHPALGAVLDAGRIALVGWRERPLEPLFGVGARFEPGAAWFRDAVRPAHPVARAPFGGGGLALFAEPDAGITAVVWLTQQVAAVPPKVQEALTRLALHVEAAARLRSRGTAPVGRVTPEGRVELGDSSSIAGIARAAELLGRIRGAGRADGDAALASWPMLVDGQHALVPCADGGFHVVPNAPGCEPIPALNRRLGTIVQLSARGLSNKHVAHALGATPASVSKSLGTVCEKLGISDSRTLVRLARGFRADGRTLRSIVELTPAEWSVVDLVSRGLSNADIARLRGSEERTVANQLATIVRKTGGARRHGRR